MDRPEYLIQYHRLLELMGKVDKYEEKTIKGMLDIFDQATTDIKKGLKSIKSVDTKARMRKLGNQLEKAHKALALMVKEKLETGIAEVSEETFKGMEKILSWDGKDKKFNVPLDRVDSTLNALATLPVGGRLLADWIDKTFEDTAIIQRQILASNIAGESYRKMYNRLANVYPDYTRKELITLARTYNQSVIVSAQEKLFEENKDIVKKVRWSAAMEMGYSKTGRGTCCRCAALDGNEYEQDARKPNCPLHARCRCMWSPITVTWNELFKKHRLTDKNGNDLTHDEMEEQYRPFLTRKDSNIDVGRGKGNILNAEWTDKPYGEFIEGKGKAVLTQVVGPNRAALIDSGKIKFKDMVNRETGDLLTLEQLGYPIRTIKIQPVRKKDIVPKKKTGGDGGGNVPPVPISIDLSESTFKLKRGRTKEEFSDVLNKLPEDQKQMIRDLPKPRKMEISAKGLYYRGESRVLADPKERNGGTLRHEYGHHLDAMIGKKLFGDIGYASPRVEHFKNAYNDDMDKLGFKRPADIDKMPMKTREDRKAWSDRIEKFNADYRKSLDDLKVKFYNIIDKDLGHGIVHKSTVIKDVDFAGYSDIIDAMTKGIFHKEYKAWGHGTTYYSRTENRYLETFANLFEARKRPKVWEVMKEDFPNLVESFEKIIKEVLK